LNGPTLELIVSKVWEALRAALSSDAGPVHDLKIKRSKIEREMSNLTNAICNGGGSDSLDKTIQMKEIQLRSVDEDIGRRMREPAIPIDQEHLRGWVKGELSDCGHC